MDAYMLLSSPHPSPTLVTVTNPLNYFDYTRKKERKTCYTKRKHRIVFVGSDAYGVCVCVCVCE
jgi:hypothetical protein